MNVVLDANVLISAIIFGGKPRIILELIVVDKKLNGVISRKVFNELLGVLLNKFKYSQDQLVKIENLIKENFVIISPQTIPNIIKEDDFDNQVLAIAGEIKIDYIISGDNHLLKVKNYKNAPIITPHFFVDKILKIIEDSK